MKKLLLITLLGGVCCMLLYCSNEEARKATWLWDAALLHDADDVIAFLTEQQFNTVFVQIDASVEQDVYAAFITQAHEEHIVVYALDGEPTWATDDALLVAYFQWLGDYMNTYTHAPFDGVHLDVEPYLHPRWQQQEAFIVEQFQLMLTNATKQAATLHIPIEADLPFWFDDVHFDNAFGEGNVAQWAIELLDGVTIMAYRDNAEDIVAITQAERQFAKAANRRLTIGVETMRSEEGAFVSFYGRDTAYLSEQLRIIERRVDKQAFAGFAIHHYRSYVEFINTERN